MRRMLIIFLLLATVVGDNLCLAADHGTAEQAVEMVRKAISYAKVNGMEKTFAEINNPNGQFVDLEIYVTALNMSGKFLAHPNPKLRGKDVIALKDVNGKSQVKEELTALKTNPSTWIDYVWPNPISNSLEHKSTYGEKYNNVVFSCGIYKQ